MRPLNSDETIRQGDSFVPSFKQDRPIPCEFTIGLTAGELIRFSNGDVMKVLRENDLPAGQDFILLPPA